ncbi:hypothetical protein P8452_43619 [Trifolium repens]|nr:hypothetical protein P8452_43619 [Trifolium repens]
MKLFSLLFVVAALFIMIATSVGGQTPPPPPLSTAAAMITTTFSPEADHPTLTTTSPVITITINYIPTPPEPEASHHIKDIFFFVFGFVGLSLLVILCIITCLVFNILRGKTPSEEKMVPPIGKEIAKH